MDKTKLGASKKKSSTPNYLPLTTDKHCTSFLLELA